MANGDFRFRSQFPISSIAQLIAQKSVTEEGMRLARRRDRRARFNQFLNTVSAASQFGRLTRQLSAQNQAEQDAIGLGESLANQVPGALPQGVQGPQRPGVATRQEAIRRSTRLEPGVAASLNLQQERSRLRQAPGIGSQQSQVVPEQAAEIALQKLGSSPEQIADLKKQRGGRLSLTASEIRVLAQANPNRQNPFDFFVPFQPGGSGTGPNAVDEFGIPVAQ